ncbi:MAG: SDR family oxidoreductase [Anaerolineae bacterium]|jgi:gluconate 5-dehydrogenase|nr:SDR family oxidoreductase [Chloroflexota bacterium]
MAAHLFDLSGRRALVTGSSRGLGYALARGLATYGAQLVLNGTREQSVAPAVASLRAEGFELSGYPFDVTDVQQVNDAVARIEVEQGPIDILVNNAGIQRRAPLLEMRLEDWQAVLETNLTSAFTVSTAVARGMIERGRGCIINIISLNVEAARPSIANYIASKGGLDALTRAMATEWGPRGIRVNSIAPGYFLTDMTRPLAEDPAFDKWVKGNIPLGRWGDPAELIGAAVFLASDASSYVTGRTIHVDGGWRASL